MEKPNRRRVASDRPAGAAKPTEDSLSRLRAIAQEMRTIPSQGKWYALTVLATKDGLANYSWYSEFSGFTKGSPRRELRQPSLVDPRKMADLWKSVGTPCVVVHNRVHLALYLRLGGTCLISREMAEYAFRKWMKPIEVGIVGAIQPSKSVSIASREELQHAPTPKLRTQILKRDDFRCLACGRRPANNSDIELHVHHIAPFAQGGLTVRTNLITLCHTCHKGLDPHHEFKLWELLQATEPVRLPDHRDELQCYQDGVKWHRALIAGFEKKILRKEVATSKSKPALRAPRKSNNPG